MRADATCKFIFSGFILDLAKRRDGNTTYVFFLPLSLDGQILSELGKPDGTTVSFGLKLRCLKESRWLKRDSGRTILLIESSVRGSNVALIRSFALPARETECYCLLRECFWQRIWIAPFSRPNDNPVTENTEFAQDLLYRRERLILSFWLKQVYIHV